ncbi:hypothetical protein O6H91_22G061900 [Diphasiastrum complanatum]|uniref:Uncharacterized protein n=1 Tax=Diphasiastrum complanatum TaxID=34168 RepID=A0ACC2AG65_DIPCM|nr:hypothetical protein O6H91_22G061900 [Diphasiastrum complanatum]
MRHKTPHLSSYQLAVRIAFFRFMSFHFVSWSSGSNLEYFSFELRGVFDLQGVFDLRGMFDLRPLLCFVSVTNALPIISHLLTTSAAHQAFPSKSYTLMVSNPNQTS